MNKDASRSNGARIQDITRNEFGEGVWLELNGSTLTLVDLEYDSRWEVPRAPSPYMLVVDGKIVPSTRSFGVVIPMGEREGERAKYCRSAIDISKTPNANIVVINRVTGEVIPVALQP